MQIGQPLRLVSDLLSVSTFLASFTEMSPKTVGFFYSDSDFTIADTPPLKGAKGDVYNLEYISISIISVFRLVSGNEPENRKSRLQLLVEI